MKKLLRNYSLFLPLLLYSIGCKIYSKQNLDYYSYYFNNEVYDSLNGDLGYGYYKCFKFNNDSNSWQINPLSNYSNSIYTLSNNKTWIDKVGNFSIFNNDTTRCVFSNIGDTVFQKSYSPFFSKQLVRKFYIQNLMDTLITNSLFPFQESINSYKTIYTGEAVIKIGIKKFMCDQVKVFYYPVNPILPFVSLKGKSKNISLYYTIYYFEKQTHLPIIIQECSNNSYIKAFIYPKNKKHPDIKKIKVCDCGK